MFMSRLCCEAIEVERSMRTPVRRLPCDVAVAYTEQCWRNAIHADLVELVAAELYRWSMLYRMNSMHHSL